MKRMTSERGFSMLELLVATAIGMIVIGTAMSAYKDAVTLSTSASQLADASQNLRVGTNLLIRDLSQAGRLIPVGGISIPTGNGSTPLLRPTPPGVSQLFFKNDATSTVLPAITTGSGLGPAVDADATDIVTILTIDSSPDSFYDPAPHPLQLNPASGAVPRIAADGSSFDVGSANAGWITGDPSTSRVGVQKGDLFMFTDGRGRSAIQVVTATSGTTVSFLSNSDDVFNFNQHGAAAGTIAQLLDAPVITVKRVMMWTYFVDPNSGEPRLMRQLNMRTPSALAGVVEDLMLTYDLSDPQGQGAVAPANVPDLPVTINGVAYSANQIRKANVHVGVRSETMSMKTKDYLRSHVSTVVSLRNLAFVDRYR